MKRRIVILSLLLSVVLSAKSQDTIYYDKGWKVTSLEHAAYFRLKWKKPEGWVVKDCYLNGKPQMEGVYSNDSCTIQHGLFTWYFENGNARRVSTFVNGQLTGVEKIYYDNGQLRTVGKYIDAKTDGEWLGYYPSGKLSSRANFMDGKQETGSFFNEDGSINKQVTEFFRLNTFPGGLPGLREYLTKNLKYPKAAVKKEIQGQVLVGFTVSKEGKVQDVTIVKSVDPLLDAEALRVVRDMPDWQPLIVGGVLCDIHQQQPINFALQNK